MPLIIGRLEDCAPTGPAGLEDADWARKRDLIRTLVKRVEVAQEQGNIVFRVDPYLGDPDPEKKSWQLCRGSDDTPLRCAGQGVFMSPVFQDTGTQKLPEKVSDIPVGYSLLHRLVRPPMPDRVKVARYVAFDPSIDNWLARPRPARRLLR